MAFVAKLQMLRDAIVAKMNEIEITKSASPKPGTMLKALPALLALTGLALLLAPVSAADFVINGTINQIVDEVILIIPNLIDLILQMLPAVIVLALLGFITGFFDKILGMFKI